MVGPRVVVATENDTVYVLDSAHGSVLWSRHLGEPVPNARILPAISDRSLCDATPWFGITSTPVVDPVTQSLYVVDYADPGRYEFVALDLVTGDIRWRTPIEPPGFDPLVQQQRAALLLSGSFVYAGFGGFNGDCGRYLGWLVGAPAAGRHGQPRSNRTRRR